jgi:hypothetical protein
MSFNLFLQSCNDNVNARRQQLEPDHAGAIEQTIWHQVDDPSLGLVDFSGAVTQHAVVDDDGPATSPPSILRSRRSRPAARSR